MNDIEDLSILSEAVAVIYSERFGIERDATWYLGKMTEELGEVTSVYLKLAGKGRGAATQSDLEDELADLLGFVLLFARWQGIDPGNALRRKWGKYLEAGHDA